MRPVTASTLSAAILLAFSMGAIAHGGGNGNKLKGEYAFTGSATCLFSVPLADGTGGGFNPNSTPVPGSRVFSSSFSVEGIRKFNANGTGTVQGTSVTITHPPTPGAPGPFSCPGCFPPSVSSNTFSFQFTYTVNGDGTWETNVVPGTFTATFLTGTRTGQTVASSGFSLVGLVGKDEKTLTVASVEPAVEVLTFSNGDVWPRICQRSRVLTKTDKDQD